MSKPGTNYFGKLNQYINISQTNESGFAVFVDCFGDPNVYAVASAGNSGIFSNGCILIRTDILIGQSVYENTGTLANPSWVLIGSGGGGKTPVFGEIVAGTDGNHWTLDNIPSGTIALEANGQGILLTVDYSITGVEITTISTYPVGTVVASYQY